MHPLELLLYAKEAKDVHQMSNHEELFDLVYLQFKKCHPKKPQQ